MTVDPRTASAIVQAAPPGANTLNPIVGTALEKVEAFRQISANLAASGLEINGWREAKEILAGCWMADALLVNPVMFMQGNWVMNMGGKKVIEPKWDFMIALLQSRVPGFRWKVKEETEERATVWMADGFGNEHEVTYTIEDAKRQGHYGRNALYKTSSREMLLAKAVKRCGKRVGAHILAGMAAFEPEYEQGQASKDAPAKAREKSMAEVMEEGAKEAPAATTEATTTPKKDLDAEIRKRWGKLTPAKFAATMNEIAKAALSGATFKNWDEVGPADAKIMLEYLRTKYRGATAPQAAETKPDTGTHPGVQTEPVESEQPAEAVEELRCSFPDCGTQPVDGTEFCEEHTPASVADEEDPGPALEEEPADPAVVGAKAQDDLDAQIDTLLGLLERAAKHPKFGRPLTVEAPAKKGGTEKNGLFMYNAEIQKAMGFARATLLLEDGESRIEPELCRRYCRWLREQGVV